MGKGLKFLLAGVVLGLMAVFSVIGVKSLIDDRNAVSIPEKTQAILNEQQQTTIPQTDVGDNQSLADTPATQAGDGTALTPETPGSDAQNSQNQVTGNATDNDSQPQQNSQDQQAENQENATQSTEQDEKLDMQLIDEYGGLQLTLSDQSTPGQSPKGEFIIRDAQDQVVAHMKDTDTASFDLSPGIYEVTVIAKGKKSARMVNIVTGEFVTEHFRLPGGATGNQQTQQQTQQQPAQQNNQQTNQQQANQQQQQAPPPANTGRLAVVVQTAGSNAPLKSNIYVQLPNGTLVTKKNYADFANFDLKPGTYKITVKAPGKVDEVRNVEIRNGHGAQAVFSMKSPAAQTQNNNPPPPQEGTLRLVLQSPANAQTPRRGRFVIQDANGKRVTRMRGVSNAEVKLKPGRYNVVAVVRGSRISKPVTISKGQVSNLVFNAGEFPQPAQTTPQQNQATQQQQQVQVPAQQGVLQLIAVDGVTRQPLKVDFMVSTLNGQRLKRAENVSVTEVAMAPQAVLVDISYQEMRGQERIQVKAGEPTVYTFTITPNTPAPINQQQQAPRSLEEMLLERLQQELLQRLN